MITIWAGVGLWGYAYVGYPAVLSWLARRRPAEAPLTTPTQWPLISITIPAHNEARAIAATLEAVLAIDYPVNRRQILVVSDASSDGTDEIVAQFASRGVELLRMPRRSGKTAAENSARGSLRGEIIVNTDSSVRIHPAAIKHLVARFADPHVGVASSRDVSIARVDTASNPGEGAYVGYEMWVRDLETRVAGIVGASGSLYAIRASIHNYVLPEALSRDFAAALVARKSGYRAVSVPEAICYVPRGLSLRQEYGRKVRTMTRGLGTLFYMRSLLNPLRYGVFAWMLASHKLIRWVLPPATIAMVLVLGVMAPRSIPARIALGCAAAIGLAAVAAWNWPRNSNTPRLIAMPAFAAGGVVAGVHAWIRLLTGRAAPTWEPTRRGHAPAR
jgi:cellulose synthase/poly-beta-1,6-N-acetylglucosamine synthase-like glycosyltransferase